MVNMRLQQPNVEELTIDYKNSDFKLVQPLGMSKWIDPASMHICYCFYAALGEIDE